MRVLLPQWLGFQDLVNQGITWWPLGHFHPSRRCPEFGPDQYWIEEDYLISFWHVRDTLLRLGDEVAPHKETCKCTMDSSVCSSLAVLGWLDEPISSPGRRGSRTSQAGLPWLLRLPQNPPTSCLSSAHWIKNSFLTAGDMGLGVLQMPPTEQCQWRDPQFSRFVLTLAHFLLKIRRAAPWKVPAALTFGCATP